MQATGKIIAILIYILIITLIAMYCGRNDKTFKDFAIGGGKIPFFIMAGTLFSTFCGGATMVAYVGNFYSQGMIWIWIPIQVSLVGIIYYFICGRIFNMRQISTTDIMTRRYGENTRLLSSIVVMIAEIGMAAAMMNTFAAMTTTYVGLSRPVALGLAVVLFILTAALGGYKGVAVTDAIQGIIIFIGLSIGVLVFTKQAGGFGAIAAAAGPEKMSIFSTANGCSFITILGTFVSSFGMHMALQSGYVSRINSVKTVKEARRGLLMYVIFITLAFAVFVPIIGMSANVLLKNETIGDSVIGTMLNLYMSPAVSIVYVAAIVSAVLTTANSSLLSASICITNDLYRGRIKKDASDKELLLVSRVSIVALTLLALAITQFFETIISMMFVTYTINALIAISLFAGLYTKKGGSTAANLSLGLGIIAVLIWVALGSPYGIHVAVVGLPIAGIGYLIGMFFGKKPTKEQMAVVDESASTA